MARAQIAYLNRKDVLRGKPCKRRSISLASRSRSTILTRHSRPRLLALYIGWRGCGLRYALSGCRGGHLTALKSSIGSRDTAIDSVGQAIRASSLPRSQFARRLSSNSAPSSMSRIKTCCYRSISCLPRRETRKGPFSRWSGKNAGAMRGVHAGTFRAKGWTRYGDNRDEDPGEIRRVDGTQARREHFVIRGTWSHPGSRISV